METNDDDTPLVPEVCGENSNNYDGVTCDDVLAALDTVFEGYMKVITKGNHDFTDRERERLEKRQDEHWQREGRHEAIERERALFRKHGMEGLGGLK